MNSKTMEKRWLPTTIALTALLLAGVAVAADSQETRSSRTSQGKGIERGVVGDGVVSFDEMAPLVTQGKRGQTTRAVAEKTQTSATSQSPAPNTDFWFYDADVELFSDFDGDGYFQGIDLQFDADTVYVSAEVYAVIYLSFGGGPWNEYASTDDFTIFGADGGDAYTVETELVSGYRTGNYDILIELFDTFDDAFVASFGPEDTSELSLLPLEDAGRDTPPGTAIVVNTEGGGSAGLFFLLSLAGIAGLFRRG